MTTTRPTDITFYDNHDAETLRRLLAENEGTLAYITANSGPDHPLVAEVRRTVYAIEAAIGLRPARR